MSERRGDAPEPPSRDPAELLELLAMAHYVLAALVALLALVPFVVAVVDRALEETSLAAAARPIPLSAILAGLLMLLGFALTAVLVWGGRCLQTRRRHGHALAAAALACLAVPVGTALGLVTWSILQREAVRSAFRPPEDDLAAPG